MESKKEVVLIGAGVAGIATAIRLSPFFRVKVIEAGDKPGGKLTEIENNGFRFDAGPSLFTLPESIDELFLIHKKDPRKYYRFEQLNNICKYYYKDGTEINAWADREKFSAELFEKTGEPPENINKYLNRSRLKYNITENLFLQRSLHKLSTWISPQALKGYISLPVLQIFKTLNDVHEDQFESEKVKQLFNRYATYNGSDPYQSPGMLSVIPHLEYNLGAYFPIGGMYSITKALFKLAKELGVEFLFDTKAEKIDYNQKAKGVVTSKGYLKADIVVSNIDVFSTYRNLLRNLRQPEKILQQPRSSSALVFYWNICKRFPELELHNIFFSDNYKAEFDSIFRKKTIGQDPTIYVNISSKYEPSDAPAGCENWFVMINVPHNSGQNWDFLIKEARESILRKLSEQLKTSIKPYIKGEKILDPTLIEVKTSSFAGSLYGNSSNNKYAAFLRHANFSSTLKNLYFCGGSVHPGGGIPLCLNSAKITSKLIVNDQA